MASSMLLKLVFKSLHHFSWPLLALVYPMCASMQAIEKNCDAEIKNIISYWILLSLIYLFEYAFMSLLLWFHLWPYIKLMIIFCLIIPDFGRASYIYNNLIRPMKLQIVTWRLNNYWRKFFVEKDDFLMHTERYMKENGTEALEKLIASKNTMCRPDAEVTNEIIATDNKEMLKSNGERLQIEHKDIKDSDAIEKKELPAFKQEVLGLYVNTRTLQDIPVSPKIGPSQIASLATVETKVTAERTSAGGEVPQSSTSTQKEVQKEWTCALCLVTTPGKKDLNSHLSGKKPRAALQRQKDAEATNEIIATDNKEILKTNAERIQTEHKDMKDLEAVEKKEIHETKQDIPVIPKIGPSQIGSSATMETKGTAEGDMAGGEVPQSSSTLKDVQKDWTCALGLVTTSSEEILNSHFSGGKHGAALQKQKDAEAINEITATDNKEIVKVTNGERLQTEHKDIKDLEAIEEKEIPATKQDIPVIPKIRPSQNASSVTVETKGTAESERAGGEVPWSSTQREVQREWTCAICLVTTSREKDLISHLNGRKHRVASEALIAKKQPTQQKRKDAEATTNKTIATNNKKIPKKNGERFQTENKNIKYLEAIDKKEIPATKQDIPVMPKIAPSQNASSATVETKGTAKSDKSGEENLKSSTQREVQKEWTCALCLVTTPGKKDLNSHLSGKKHRAALQRQKDAEATNEIIATDNKEILKTNAERIQTEHKDMKDLEAVEKKEIHETKQDIPVIPKIGPSQIGSSATMETKGTAEGDMAGGEVPQSSSTLKDVQKDWTCALGLVTTSSEEILNSHFSGGKHGAALQKQKDAEAINEITATDNKEIVKVTNGERLQTEHKDIKDLEAIEEKEIPATKQDIPVMPKIWPSKMHHQPQWKPKEQQRDTVGGEVPQSSNIAQKEVQKEWACALCLVTVPCEKTLNSHLNGRKHRAACEAALKAKKLKIDKAKEEVKPENFSNKLNSNVENGGGIVNNRLKGPGRMDHKVQKPQNFNFHFIGSTPSPQALGRPTPFSRPTSSPIRVPFSYHRGPTPFRGPTPPPIRVPFSYHGSDGSWARQPEYTYFIPPLVPNRR